MRSQAASVGREARRRFAAEDLGHLYAWVTYMPGRAQPTTDSYVSAFGDFGGRIWLNAAHQGPLPRVAVEAANEALAAKVAPHLIDDQAFVEVPRRLRE